MQYLKVNIIENMSPKDWAKYCGFNGRVPVTMQPGDGVDDPADPHFVIKKEAYVLLLRNARHLRNPDRHTKWYSYPHHLEEGKKL